MKSATTPNNKSDIITKKENSAPRPKAARKYVHPPDKNQTITDQSKDVWKLCEKSICQATNKLGYYNFSNDKAHCQDKKE